MHPSTLLALLALTTPLLAIPHHNNPPPAPAAMPRAPGTDWNLELEMWASEDCHGKATVTQALSQGNQNAFGQDILSFTVNRDMVDGETVDFSSGPDPSPCSTYVDKKFGLKRSEGGGKASTCYKLDGAQAAKCVHSY